MRYNEIVTELWDRNTAPVNWVKKSSSEWVAQIENNGKNYRLFIEDNGAGAAEVSMGNVPRFWGILDRLLSGGRGVPSGEFLGKGTAADTLRIFGGVVNAVEDFIKNAKPRAVVFSGMTPSHQKLYAMLVRKMKPVIDGMGYDISNEGDGFALKRRDLTEAPISDISLRGPTGADDFASGTGFDQVDRDLLQSPKAINKIVRAFQKTPFNFEVIFLNSPEIDGSGGDNENVDNVVRRQEAGVHDQFKGITAKHGVIRVIMLSNLSPRAGKTPDVVAAKMPMTSWTLAHKIGHAFQDDIIYRSRWQGEIGECVQQINRCLSIISDPFQGHRHGSGFTYRPDLARKLTMKSARDGKLTNPFEFFAEVVAQYLISGKVTFDLSETPRNKVTGRSGRTHEMDAVMKQAETLLNTSIHRLLSHCVGKVIVEV